RLDADRIRVLAEGATDEAEHALGGARGQLAGARIRRIDEFVDRKIRIRPNRKRGAIDEQDVRLSLGLGDDPLVVNDVAARAELAHGGAGWRAGGIGIDGTGHADAL